MSVCLSSFIVCVLIKEASKCSGEPGRSMSSPPQDAMDGPGDDRFSRSSTLAIRDACQPLFRMKNLQRDVTLPTSVTQARIRIVSPSRAGARHSIETRPHVSAATQRGIQVNRALLSRRISRCRRLHPLQVQKSPTRNANSTTRSHGSCDGKIRTNSLLQKWCESSREMFLGVRVERDRKTRIVA